MAIYRSPKIPHHGATPKIPSKILFLQNFFVNLHRNWKVGRVIECAGLEIRYTHYGYRGFESLTFRKANQESRMALFFYSTALHENNNCRTCSKFQFYILNSLYF